MPVPELTCKELVEIVTEYLEGTLPPAERERFDAHLLGCHGCNRYVEQMQQTVRALGQLTEKSVPPEGKEMLLNLFRDWKRANSDS
jgi:anti-sigma factor RsiW